MTLLREGALALILIHRDLSYAQVGGKLRACHVVALEVEDCDLNDTRLGKQWVGIKFV